MLCRHTSCCHTLVHKDSCYVAVVHEVDMGSWSVLANHSHLARTGSGYSRQSPCGDIDENSRPPGCRSNTNSFTPFDLSTAFEEQVLVPDSCANDFRDVPIDVAPDCNHPAARSVGARVVKSMHPQSTQTNFCPRQPCRAVICAMQITAAAADVSRELQHCSSACSKALAGSAEFFASRLVETRR